jgi:biopolymer transport protein ExbD
MAFKKKKSKGLSAGLTLTSLVDCFSILIVYLLMATAFGENLFEIPKGMNLPKSAHSDQAAADVVVQVRGFNYSIDGLEVPISSLARELKNKASLLGGKENISLVIQADQSSEYSQINPLVIAGMTAGFHKVQFAVLEEEL